MKLWRIIIDIVVLAGAFLLPWWFSLTVAAVALFIFPMYIEILFLGLIIDSLYNAPVAYLHRFQFFVTALAIALYIIARLAKSRLRWYR